MKNNLYKIMQKNTNIDKKVSKPINVNLTEFVCKLDDQNLIDIYRKLNESVLDPVNKERCSDIFVNDSMKKNVRDFILKLANDFKDQSEAEFDYKALYMIGSSTGYQYSLTSDIDITAVLTLPKEQWKSVSAITPKNILLPGTNRPINFFLILEPDEFDFNHAENIYDILNNKWIKKSDKSNIKVPYPYIKNLATFFMNGCDLALSRYQQDKQELEEYLSLDPEHQEISAEEKSEAVDRKLVDLKNDMDLLKMAHHIIWRFEREGYEDMPFKINIELENNKDPRYSVNNLVYKMIDKFGYLGRLDSAIKEGWQLIERIEKE